MSEAQLLITVGHQLLVPIIDGGSFIRIPSNSALSLSAASSYDPDVSTASAASVTNSSLSFSWTCSAFDGVVDSPCLNASGGALSLSQGPLAFIPPGTLFPSDWPYVFTVTVQKPGRAPASAVMPVDVLSGSGLIVSIATLCWRHTTDQAPCCAAADGTMIANSDSRLQLTAAVVGGKNISLSWTVSPQLRSNTSDEAIAPIGYSKLVFVLLGSEKIFVTGNQYSISVIAADGQTGAQGSGVQQLWINSPPIGGDFSACLLPTTGPAALASGTCEREGQAVIDTFRLSCQRWVDPDGDPTLAYRFGFLVVGAAGDTIVAAAADSAAMDAAASAASNQTVWFDWAADSVRDMTLPGGELVLFAQVCRNF